MSETDKKSKRRKERGLNIRVVQEQKDKKSSDVRVNTPIKKSSPRKKTAKRASEKSSKSSVEKIIEKTDVKKNSKSNVNKNIEKTTKKVAKEENIYTDLSWKEEKPVKKPLITRKETTRENFETLKLHTDKNRAESKIILRDVAREYPAKVAPFAIKAPSAPQPSRATRAQQPSEPVVIQPQKISAKELKEREIQKAVSVATKLPQTSKKQTRRSRMSRNFGATKVILAIGCLSLAVFALVLLVTNGSGTLTSPLGASGIETNSPSHVPRGYSLVDVTSASGQVIMKFKSDEGGYIITKEQTDWNSAGLLANFVKPTYGDDYSMIEEQGLTLYIGDKWGAWVNGGVFYSLTVDSGNLTKKQIKAIATSP